MSEDEQRSPIPGIVWLMLALLLILGLGGVAFAVPRVIGHTSDVQRAKAAGDISDIRNALNHFRLHCDRYPTTKEGLDVLLAGAGIKGWSGPYLPRLVPDPWGNPYLYEDLGNDNIQVYSLGADKAKGGVGDAEDIGLDIP
jgi:general secretion pathway protein G